MWLTVFLTERRECKGREVCPDKTSVDHINFQKTTYSRGKIVMFEHLTAMQAAGIMTVFYSQKGGEMRKYIAEFLGTAILVLIGAAVQ